MRLGRLVRKVDDVAEVLIFDVLLGTRCRRWVMAALAALAGLALYVASGFLLAAAAYPEARKIDSAPVIDDKTFSPHAERAMNVAYPGTIAPADVEPLRNEVAARQAALDRVVSVVNGGFHTFPEEPNFRNVRVATNLLAARGTLRARDGDGRALEDWLTAARLGRIAGRGRQSRGFLIDAMIGVACERVAVRAMSTHARAGTMRRGEARAVLDDLRTRSAAIEPLRNSIARERDHVLGIVRRWAETGALSRDVDSPPLRLWLPVRAGARREAAVQMEALIRETYAYLESVARTPAGPKAYETVLHKLCSTCRSGGSLGVAAHQIGGVFSRETGARHAVFFLMSNFVPNLHAAYERYDRRELEVAELFALCRAVEQGLPPSSVAELPPAPWMPKKK